MIFEELRNKGEDMLEKEYGIEKAEYRRGLEQTMLIFEGETAYIADYQMKMWEEKSLGK